ncbi:MAG: tRNA 2-thiocytidine(32) synthetase TtcA, partial [Acidiferrobacteraceae bacterium]
PLAYCQEKDIARYASEQGFPIIPCNLCGSQENMSRQRTKQLIAQLAAENPKIPSNILHALGKVNLKHLMDRTQFDFQNLENDQFSGEIDQILSKIV